MSPEIVEVLKSIVAQLDTKYLSTNPAFRCIVDDAEKNFSFRAQEVKSRRQKLALTVHGGETRYYSLFYDPDAKAIFVRIIVLESIVVDVILVSPVFV